MVMFDMREGSEEQKLCHREDFYPRVFLLSVSEKNYGQQNCIYLILVFMGPL